MTELYLMNRCWLFWQLAKLSYDPNLACENEEIKEKDARKKDMKR